jgi:hypothetical protein
MKPIARLLSILCVTASLAAIAATEENIKKQYPIQPGGKLVVDVDFGSIEVRTNGTKEVVVEVWRKITRRSKSDEEAFLKENPVNFSNEGNSVSLRARHKEKSGWSWFSSSGNRNEAKYIITVPAQFDAKLDTSGGRILVWDLNGHVEVHTSGGPLDFARLHGKLEGDTSGGSIRSIDCDGTLKLHTNGGGIDVAGGGGTLAGETSGGSILVKNFQGPAHIETSGGGITVDKVQGQVDGSTSGGAIVAILNSPLAGPVKLETSGGSVTAHISEGAAFNLDAESVGGGVSSDLPVVTTGKREHNRLKGPVNGGGKLIELRTSGGSIRVEKLGKLSQARN